MLVNRVTNAHLAHFLVLSLCAVFLAIFIVPTSTLAEAASRPSGDKTPPFVATLQPELVAAMKQMQVPGAIISIDLPGQGSWTTTMGTSNLTTNAPISVKSYMRIGSITKTFTATVILRLVEQHKLRLDDPISKYQPEVPNGTNITVRELLNMTSGLFDYTTDLSFGQTLIANPHKVWQPEELLAIAFKNQPYFAPGQGIRYSSTNYILLGMLIEQITHKPVQQSFQEDIFEPLGMRDTSLPALTSAAIPDPHPRGYVPTSLTGTTPPFDVTDWNPSWGWTAGSAISTLHDLKIWAKALATGTLLHKEMQEERLSWIDLGGNWVGKPVRYGLGVADFGGVIGHNGSIPGFQSFMGYQPQKKATVIVMVNFSNLPDGTLPADALEQTIQQQLFT